MTYAPLHRGAFACPNPRSTIGQQNGASCAGFQHVSSQTRIRPRQNGVARGSTRVEQVYRHPDQKGERPACPLPFPAPTQQLIDLGDLVTRDVGGRVRLHADQPLLIHLKPSCPPHSARTLVPTIAAANQAALSTRGRAVRPDAHQTRDAR